MDQLKLDIVMRWLQVGAQLYVIFRSVDKSHAHETSIFLVLYMYLRSCVVETRVGTAHAFKFLICTIYTNGHAKSLVYQLSFVTCDLLGRVKVVLNSSIHFLPEWDVCLLYQL